MSTLNHVVGNRFSNSFNGIFFQSSFDGGNGRASTEGRLCTHYERLGRIHGNTCRGHGRFGMYFLGAYRKNDFKQDCPQMKDSDLMEDRLTGRET